MIRPCPSHGPAFAAASRPISCKWTARHPPGARHPRATADERPAPAHAEVVVTQLRRPPSEKPNHALSEQCQQVSLSGASCPPASSAFPPPRPLLLHIDEAPAWTRDKSGAMRSGYRPCMPAGECVRSLWYPHNQSGSVWTFIAKLGISSVTCFELCRSLGPAMPADGGAALGAAAAAIAAAGADGTGGTATAAAAFTATSAAAAAAPLLLLLAADYIHTPASIAFHLFQPVSPELKMSFFGPQLGCKP